MNILYIILAISILTSCKTDQNKENTVEMLDFKPFFYPYKKLIHPKVYVYQNKYSSTREYHHLRTEINSRDTVLEIIVFDSLYLKSSVMRWQIDDHDLTQLNGTQYLQTEKNKVTKIPINYTKSVFSWIRPLSKDSTYITEFFVNFQQGRIDFTFKGYFEKVSRALEGATYKPNDIVKNPETVIVRSSIAVKGKKLMVSSNVTYYAKGLGMLMYEVPISELVLTAKSYRFLKIISEAEFEELSHGGI